MPRTQSAANLIPVVEIAETHFVTTEGRIGVVLETEGRNISIMSAEEAESLVGAYADLLNYLETDVHMQITVSNRPRSAAEWVPLHMRQYAGCPPRLAPVRDRIAARYEEQLVGRHIPNLRFLVTLTIPGAPVPKGRTGILPKRAPSRVLLRDRRLYEQAVGEISRVAQDAVTGFEMMGIAARPLGRQGMIDLYRSFMSPQWCEIDRVDCENVPSAVSYPGQYSAPNTRRRLPFLRRAVASATDADPAAHAATMQQLSEVLAVGHVHQRTDHMVVDGARERTIALRTLPDATFAGYLDKLFGLTATWRVSIHIGALDKRKETARLRTKHRQLHGVNQNRLDKDLAPDIEQEERQAEIEGTLRQFNQTDARAFRMAVFVTVRAETKGDLNSVTRDVIYALSDAGGTMINRCITHQVPAWCANLPGGRVPPDGDYAFRAISANVADTFPFLHHRAGTPTGMLVGFSNPGRELTLLNPWHAGLPNFALAAVGKSGSGKTVMGQILALHTVLQGGKVLVLDRSNGHWDALVQLVGGESVSVSLDGTLCINPWELKGDQLRQYRVTGVPPNRKVENLIGLVTLMVSGQSDGVSELRPDEKGGLERAIREVYAAVPNPVMSDLFDLLAAENDPVAGSLADRLSPYVGGGVYAGLLDGPTSIPADAPIEVYNFADLTRKIVPLAMFLLLDHFWEAIKSRAQRTLFVMDEGWSLLRNPDTADFMEEVARRARHFGLSVLNMSQSVEDYDNDTGKAVIANTSLSVLLAQHPSQLPHVESVFELGPDERDTVAGFRKATRHGASAYLHSPEGAESGALHLWVTPEEYWLFTSAPEPRDEPALRRAAIERHGGDAWAACRELAEHDGPDPGVGTEATVALRSEEPEPSGRPRLSVVE
jgi:hypothetical protein